MKINLSPDNKAYLRLIFLVFLVVVAVAGWKYWQKNYISAPIDTPSEEAKNACLEEMNQATDQELIDEVNILEYPYEIDIVSGENRITAAHKSMINYFTCKVGYVKNEETYNLAKDFIENLDIQEENKQKSLVGLEESISKDKSISISNIIAVGFVERLCIGDNPTDEFIELDKRSIEEKFLIKSNLLNENSLYSEEIKNKSRSNLRRAVG